MTDLGQAEKLVIAYALNRVELREVKAVIQKLLWPPGTDGEPGGELINRMSSMRADWYGQDCDGYGSSPGWPGWVQVAEDFEEDDLLPLATLYERRNDLVRQGGNLKRSICSHGRALKRRLAT